jgi:hypothetical protein
MTYLSEDFRVDPLNNQLILAVFFKGFDVLQLSMIVEFGKHSFLTIG